MRTRRVTALLLALALLLGMTACGKQDKQENKTLAQELGFGYLSEYQDMDLGLDWINRASAAQGKLYVLGDYYDEENYESGTCLYEMDPVTGDARQIPLPELYNEPDGYEYIQNVLVCPDGSGYWMMSVVSHWESSGDWEEPIPFEEPVEEEISPEEDPTEEAAGTDGREETLPVETPEPAVGMAAPYQVDLLSAEAAVPEADPAPEAEAAPDAEPIEDEVVEDYVDEDFAYTEPTEQYLARKCDMEGNLISEIDLTAATADLEYFYPQNAVQTPEGDLLISNDTTILRFDANGNRKEDIPCDFEWVDSLTASADGHIAVSYYDSNSGNIQVATLENGTISAPLDLSTLTDRTVGYSMNLYSGEGSTILMNDGSFLYSMDLATGQGQKLLNWLDSDINSSNIQSVVANGEDQILVLIFSWRTDDASFELGTMTKTPADEIPQRTVLTMGAEYMDEILQQAVIDFNRKNDTYRITLKDYSVYNTEEDFMMGSKQLDMDVISGSGPDIICLNSGNSGKYAGKGVLTDLKPYLEKDPDISLDDLVAGPLKAYTDGDKLYGIPAYFNLETIYGSAKLLEGRESWTMDEMCQAISNLPEDVRVSQWYSRTDFMANMIAENLDLFVDYSKATCNFDSDAFKQLLQACMKLPAEINYDDDNFMYMDEMQQLQSGECLMSYGYLSSAYEVRNLLGLYNGENGIINVGYPAENGNGALLSVYDGLAISEKCREKDGAWAFVKTILSDDVQDMIWGFPMTVEKLDESLAEAMEPDYYLDENGEKVFMDPTSWIGDTEYPLTLPTKEDLESFKDYINGAGITGFYDNDVLQIVSEEAEAFFAGDKSADEVAKLIQNRVTIYLGETS